jgi:uncharacterized metal-binding protein
LTGTILVIPCSGIGKPFGTISREATYSVVEDLKKDETDTVCLSLLVMGDEETRNLIKTHQCIAVDGCPAECSRKNIELSGGKLAAAFRVVDLLRQHRDLKTQNVTFLDENGKKLAGIMAQKIASKVDELNRGGNAE